MSSFPLITLGILAMPIALHIQCLQPLAEKAKWSTCSCPSSGLAAFKSPTPPKATRLPPSLAQLVIVLSGQEHVGHRVTVAADVFNPAHQLLTPTESDIKIGIFFETFNNRIPTGTKSGLGLVARWPKSNHARQELVVETLKLCHVLPLRLQTGETKIT